MKPHYVVLPFKYIPIFSLKEGDFLASSYNQFIANFSWNFVKNYNYIYATNKHVKFVLTDEAQCVFEGILQAEKNAIFARENAVFDSFKINSAYLYSTDTDFNDWDNLAACKSLHHIKILEFVFVNQWLSMPTEKFVIAFQNIPQIIIKCHCTGGFHNLINPDELERQFKEQLPNTIVNIEITANPEW